MPQPLPNIKNYSLPTRTGVYPVTVAEMGEHLRIDPDQLVDETAELDRLIKSATETAEDWTKLTLVDSDYTAYIDRFFSDVAYEVRRGPLVSMTKVEYYTGGVLTELNSAEYYTTVQEKGFSRLAPVNYWPTADERLQAVKLTFSAGFVDVGGVSSVPYDLKEAIRQHVAALYANRGDCLPQNAGLSTRGAQNTSIPVYTNNVYTLNRVVDVYVGF